MIEMRKQAMSSSTLAAALRSVSVTAPILL
jgi:hypothetical protein